MLAAVAALLAGAAPATADPVDTTPPGVPQVDVLTYVTQDVDRVMAWGGDSDLSGDTIKLVAVARPGHRATFDAILALRQAG